MGHRSNDRADPPSDRGRLDRYIQPREVRRDHLDSLRRRGTAQWPTVGANCFVDIRYMRGFVIKYLPRRGLEPLRITPPDPKSQVLPVQMHLSLEDFVLHVL